MNSTEEKQMWESGELSLAEQQEIEQELASLEAGEKHQHQQENNNAATTKDDEAKNGDVVAVVTSNAAEEEEEEQDEEKKKKERKDEVQWEVLPERDMELSFRDDGKEEEAQAEQRQRVQRQLAQVSFLEKRLQRTLIDTLVLAAVARAMWEETHTAAHGMEGREYHLLVSSVLNGLREHVESLIERQVPEQKQLGLLALGGYRSLLLVTQECLSHAHSILSVYTRSRVHSPINNTPALSVEDKTSKEHERAKGTHSLSASPQAEAPISASLSPSRDRKKLTSSAPSVPTVDAPPRHKASADRSVSSPSGSSANSNNSASTPPFSSFASSISSAFSSAFSTTSATTPRRKSHTTTTEPDKWISSPATSLTQLKEEMEGTLSLLQQLVHIFKICNVIPLDAEKYFSLTLDEIENMFPESLEWKLDMFPHYVGFEYSKELMQYVRLLDVFYIASTKAYNATNPLTKKTIFSSSVVKYNVLPKEAAVLAANCKKNLSREVLISVWELLEDQVFRWLAVNSGFFPKVKITVNSRITIPFPSSSSPSSSPSFSSAASVVSPDEQKKSNSSSTEEEVPVIHARFFWHRPKKRTSTLSASPTTNSTTETSEKAGKQKPTTAESRFGSFMSYVSQQWSKEEKQQPTKQGATTGNHNHDNNVEETQKVMQEETTSAPKKKEKQNEEGGDGQEPAFLILHIHGGGFISQTSNSHSMYLKQWAHDLGIPIVSIDYTKAPAGHYPIPLTECYTAYKWLQTNYHQLGIPHNPLGIRILLAGDSAGGNLCAALTLKALEEDKVLPPIGTILFYPAVTLTATGGISRLAFCHDPILNYRTLMLCQEAYLSPVQQEAAATDYFISPGVAPNYLLAQFPPTFVILGGIDPLLDDGLLFAQRLRENGRQVTIKLFDTLPHGFLNLSQAIPSAQKAVSYTTACFRHLIRNFLEASKDPWNSKDIASSSSSSSSSSSVSSSSLPA